MGQIYAMINPSFNKDFVRIDYTENMAKEISYINEKLNPFNNDFYVYMSLEIYIKDINIIYKFIDEANTELRVPGAKPGWYKFDPEQIFKLFDTIAILSNNKDEVIFNPLNKDYITKLIIKHNDQLKNKKQIKPNKI